MTERSGRCCRDPVLSPTSHLHLTLPNTPSTGGSLVSPCSSGYPARRSKVFRVRARTSPMTVLCPNTSFSEVHLVHPHLTSQAAWFTRRHSDEQRSYRGCA